MKFPVTWLVIAPFFNTKFELIINLSGQCTMSGITILGQYKPLTLREDTTSKSYFFFRPDDKLVDHEEEISIQDNVVIWTAGQVVKRKITLEHNVIQVIWANFSADPNKNTKTDLCILHQGTSVYLH